MTHPILTVVTVCFNAAATLEATLQSVATRPAGVEYIVIDGGSKDATLQILKNYSSIVDVLLSERDGGIFDAMNKGAELANGEFIAFLNADDTYLPGALQKLVESLQYSSGVDVYCADWHGIDAAGEEHQRTADPEFDGRHRMCHQAVIARRTALPSPPFDLRYRLCADFDLLLRWQQEGRRFQRLPFALVRFSEVGASAKFLKRSIAESITVAMRRAKFWYASIFSLRMGLYFLKSQIRSILHR